VTASEAEKQELERQRAVLAQQQEARAAPAGRDVHDGGPDALDDRDHGRRERIEDIGSGLDHR